MTLRETDPTGDIPSALLASAVAVLAVCMLVAPVYLLALGVASFIAFSKGADLLAEILPAAQLWQPLLGTAVFAGAFMLFACSRRRVVWFMFDADSRKIEYRTQKLSFQSKPVQMGFESIIKVTPVLYAQYSREGHFNVDFKTNRGAIQSLWVGDNIPLAELDRHAQWLASKLQGRVQPPMYLDY